MRQRYLATISVLEAAFHQLEGLIPEPAWIACGDSGVFRYNEKSLHQALILKLARYISGLHAVDRLLYAGLFQEQGVIQRVLDELHEDIIFLVAAVTNDEVTERHAQYLEEFWAEQFPDPTNTFVRHTKPNQVPRKKIRAYVNRVLNPEDPNPSKTSDVGEIIQSVYSGYVHASSTHIMDMYGGSPPRFHLSGMQGTSLAGSHTADAWNYYYRGIGATIAIAKANGLPDLVASLYSYQSEFEKTRVSAERLRP